MLMSGLSSITSTSGATFTIIPWRPQSSDAASRVERDRRLADGSATAELDEWMDSRQVRRPGERRTVDCDGSCLAWLNHDGPLIVR